MALKKIKNQVTKSYFAFEYSNHIFYIDIVEDTAKYSAWMYSHDYGVKWFLLGVMKSDTNIKEFKKMAFNEADNLKSQYLFDFL